MGAWRQMVEDWANETPDRVMEVPERGPATPDAHPLAMERVEVATWIVLRPGTGMFVNAGDRIPFGYEHLPRMAA